MALEPEINPQHGVLVGDSYCRVEDVVAADDGHIYFRVLGYASKADADAGAPALFNAGSQACPYDATGAAPAAQAYAYLKTLPQFAGAADV